MLNLQGRAAGETWRTEMCSTVASRKQSVITQKWTVKA